VARSPGDGYTLLFSASAFTTTPMTQKVAAYDVVKDFAPVALVAKAPLAIAVNKNLPFNDVKGLMAYAVAHPGKLTFAIGSTGSAGHLSTELLRRVGKMEYLIVPYKGSAPAYQDLVGGSIDAFIDPILGSASFAKAGQLKVLAVTSKNRVPSQPDMPTVAETVPGYEFYSWYGLWGPASLPKEIATRLNTEVNKALASDMRDKLTPQGLLLTPGSIDDFVRFQKDDMALSQRIITEGKIRAE
jgi:tripartite-type tricarboxylate transporter receptor subunit TctC